MINHLLSVEDLDSERIDRLMSLSRSFKEVVEGHSKKAPNLVGRRVLNVFYESSTRTRSSFEIAAKTLGAEVSNFSSTGSSVEKGESLKDTVKTLSAYRPDLIVFRSPYVGGANLITQWTNAAVVNAGDGKHEHPTQALLDLFTLLERFGSLEDKQIWIVGDVLHSRVARSNISLFNKMGAHVTVCGPPTLIPRDIEALGCKVTYSLEQSDEADVLYALRMQHERMSEAFIASIAQYRSDYQIDARRLRPRQLVMHAGPVNRGVELSAQMIDDPRSLITDQVAAGVVVRMAVMYDLLTGRNSPIRANARSRMLSTVRSA